MENFLEIALKEFGEKKVAVIGDVMLDRTERGKISHRVNPEDPKVPILNASEKFYLGGAANVAMNIISLGSNCDLYGVIGNDLYGFQLKKLCVEGKINIENLLEENFPTILKSRTFVKGNYVHRSDLGEDKLEKINGSIERDILNKLKKNIDFYNGIILSDYDKRIFTKEFTQEIIYMSNELGVPIFVDPKPQNIDFFKGCKIICQNKKEAEKITGIKYSKDHKILQDMGICLSKKINSGQVIITCGKDGAYIYYNGNSKMISTDSKKVVEVTGAGDTFISTLSLGIISGLDIYEAAKLANYASGIVVGKAGTVTTNIEEILEKINKKFYK